ncbi:hypothetical protein EJB05_36797 [Eragrostis curvula]|uniref:Homeobox domain-containing protein n=1 Tax=Eragrostis curvula TaxID=38414 RepID=A0A5J9UAE6_9POAL|nr:hypothetical protein EJB05_36797 [Eragrostis curvula]
MDKNTDPCPIEGNDEIGNNMSSSQNPGTLEQQVSPSTPQMVQNTNGVRKNYKRAANRGKKDSQVQTGRKYTLRPSGSDTRVLRSKSNSRTVPAEPVQPPEQPPAKRRKRGRPSKGSPRKRGRPSNGGPSDEFSQIRKRVRYILNRMNYEQSLLEAYANDGWKSQSLEKIRPEKELERAKGEILRCKLRIREVFQNLDSLLSKGKIDESLFDSDGEIACEDIFCATCGSKDVTLNNDIILCDGVCDRGFHQNCLTPPLLTEDIPDGDEGWLCPACDCKIDCIDVINELQGSDLSVDDSWEKVFPEAAALANGSKQDETFDLPSDDSEDDDFDPDMAEEQVASKEEGSSEEDEDEGSDSDDSNFLTSSDSEPLMDKKKADDLGLPSEDSEDDDYDPAGPDSDKDIQKEKSSSDESDFTSDSDEFCVEIAKSGDHDEVSKPSFPDDEAGDTTCDMEKSTAQANTANSSVNSMEAEMDQNLVLPGSGRRKVERLDYKKLYDETYDKESSDSSDDEEWSGNSTPEKGNEEPGEAEANPSAVKSSRRTRVVPKNDELTPQRVHPDSLHGSADQKSGGDLTSNGSNSTTRKGQFGPIINQRLHEHFKTEPYPSRAVKERLAEELGLTFRQVSKWFESKRHFAKVASASKSLNQGNHSAEKTNSPAVANMQVKDPENAVMEKPDVCRIETENDGVTSGNLNEGCKKPSVLKNRIKRGRRSAATSPGSKQGRAKNLSSPKGGSGDNHHMDASISDATRSNGNSTEDQIPEVDLVDETRKKAIQRELKKKKMGR